MVSRINHRGRRGWGTLCVGEGVLKHFYGQQTNTMMTQIKEINGDLKPEQENHKLDHNEPDHRYWYQAPTIWNMLTREPSFSLRMVKVSSFSRLKENGYTWLTLVLLIKLRRSTPTTNFQPIRLFDQGFLYKFTYLMANSADPDQLASSEANWSGSTLFAKAG